MNEKLDTHFYNFLAEGNIICGLKAETSEEAIRELVQRLVRNNAGLNADRILEFVMEREKVMPTVIAPRHGHSPRPAERFAQYADCSRDHHERH